jgi:hypothetical protein
MTANAISIRLFALLVLVCGVSSAAEQTLQMQVTPLARPAARPMMMPRPANDEAASNAAIDSQLSHFAAANAGNPGVQAALESAAAEVRANPEAFINADGAINQQALSGLLRQQFGSAGNIVMPRVAMDYATGNAGLSPPATLSDLGDGDIMALAFIVMMEAAKSEREDLKQIMDSVKAIDAEKQRWRTTTNATAGEGKDVDGAKDTIKEKLDNLDEMGETESLRLQMAMDRLSKLMSTLSNVLNKSSNTSDEIIQNIK